MPRTQFRWPAWRTKLLAADFDSIFGGDALTPWSAEVVQWGPDPPSPGVALDEANCVAWAWPSPRALCRPLAALLALRAHDRLAARPRPASLLVEIRVSEAWSDVWSNVQAVVAYAHQLYLEAERVLDWIRERTLRTLPS